MDKAALGSKVSCAHFDETMEHLEERMRELLRRVLGQEQRWQEAQQRFSDALDSKVRGALFSRYKTGSLGALQPEAASL